MPSRTIAYIRLYRSVFYRIAAARVRTAEYYLLYNLQSGLHGFIAPRRNRGSRRLARALSLCLSQRRAFIILQFGTNASYSGLLITMHGSCFNGGCSHDFQRASDSRGEARLRINDRVANQR